MRVLLFTTIFPSSHEPLRGIYNLRTFERLGSRCEIRAISPTSVWRRFAHPEEFGTVPREMHGGFEVTYPSYWMIPRLAPQRHANTLYSTVRSHVYEVQREFKADALVAVFAYPDVVAAARLATDLGLPLIASVVGSDINDLAQRSDLRPRIREGLSRAQYVIAVSQRLRERVLELGVPPERVITQHNGVEGNVFKLQNRAEARTALKFAHTGRLITFVGNLVVEKGPDILVDAVKRLPSGLDDVRFVFLGDGVLRTPLMRQVIRLGLQDRVLFIGRQPPDVVSLWLSASNALCLPSRREGCPNAVLEALACGRPVVAAGVGGVPELISNVNGVLVPPNDSEGLARGITQLLEGNWNPEDIRRTAPALSWDDVASVFYSCLLRATTSWQEGSVPGSPHLIGAQSDSNAAQT